MGKRITSQRRGHGGSTYRAPSHRYVVDLKYRRYDEAEKTDRVEAVVRDIIPAPERSAPLLCVEYKENEKGYMLGIEGVKVGDTIEIGVKAKISFGNVLPLANMPDGTPVCNIENTSGDYGSLVRASGNYALVINHEGDNVTVHLPSGSLKTMKSGCKATVGVVAGGGRLDKPIMKAGKHYHMIKPKAKYWPVVRKVAMNAVNHPFGGGSHSPGKPTTVSRRMPPGRKVGLIAARRTGRR